MNHLLKIISQDINTLNSLVEHLMDKEEINPLEIDLALRKVNDVYNELLMLKPNSETNFVTLTPEKESKQLEVVEEVIVEKVIVPAEEDVKSHGSISDEVLIEKLKEPEQEATILDLTLDEEVRVAEEEMEIPIVDELIESESGTVNQEERESIAIESEPIVLQEEKEELDEAVQETALKSNVNAEVIAEKSSHKSTLADKFNDAAPSLNDIQAGINKHKYLAAQFKDKPIEKLSKAIKINDRIWFVNELFNKDAANYTEVLLKIDAMNNLDEALGFIFENYQWDQEKKSTISFLELVFRRFAQ